MNEEIVYFELNNWMPDKDYPNAEPFKTWISYKHFNFDNEDWIKDNKDWLDKITTAHSIQKEIYYAIQSKDFRAGSCGGCV